MMQDVLCGVPRLFDICHMCSVGTCSCLRRERDAIGQPIGRARQALLRPEDEEPQTHAHERPAGGLLVGSPTVSPWTECNSPAGSLASYGLLYLSWSAALSPDVSSLLLMLCWDTQATCHPRCTWFCQPGRAALREPSPDKSFLIAGCFANCLSSYSQSILQVQLTHYGFPAGRADKAEA